MNILITRSFEQEICFTEEISMKRRIVMIKKTASPVNYLALLGEGAAVNVPEFDIYATFVHCLKGLRHS